MMIGMPGKRSLSRIYIKTESSGPKIKLKGIPKRKNTLLILK